MKKLKIFWFKDGEKVLQPTVELIENDIEEVSEKINRILWNLNQHMSGSYMAKACEYTNGDLIPFKTFTLS